MNNVEAKFVLQAYRPSGADAMDPVFSGALEQAKQDPELGRWLGRMQDFDRTVASKLREVQAPADLRASILAGGRVSEPARAGGSWWRRHPALAMAAGILVMLAVGTGVWWKATRAYSDREVLGQFAMDYVASGFLLAAHSEDVGQLRQWLAKRSAPLPTQLPAGFGELRGLGCKTIEYRGHDISLLCFSRGKEYHLFVARRDDFPDMPDYAEPHFASRNGYVSAAWSDARNHYVLVTDDGMPGLRRSLGLPVGVSLLQTITRQGRQKSLRQPAA